MKTCVITGANSGIGRCAAQQLAAKNMRVILACRSMARAQPVCDQIRREAGSDQVFARRVDLSLVADTRRFVTEYTAEFGTLDVLINNAADFDLARKTPLMTAEGHETQFATNLQAPFVLMEGLMPLLKQSEGRVLNIGTQGLTVYPNLTFGFDNINGGPRYSPAKTYYQTKLGLLMLSLLARERYGPSGVTVYGVRVPNVKVDIVRYPGISPVLKAMYKVKSTFSISPEDMATAYTELATGDILPGFYYDEKLREVGCNKSAYDADAQARLWELCERLTAE